MSRSQFVSSRLNYDTVLEQFCNDFRLSYSDGFDLEWNPAGLERDDVDFQLYKLHGSITWYETDQGKYIKLPVFVDQDEVQLFTMEKARSLMIYPAQKSPQNEPILQILLKLKDSLAQADLAVVAGYSFRDAHIVQMFWEAARANRRLHILLVGPHAFEIYRDRLRNYPSGAPSSLEGRVAPLPFLWEKAFPQLKPVFLNGVRLGRTYEENARIREMQGEPVDWSGAAVAYAQGGHYEGAERCYALSKFANAAQRVEVLLHLWMQAKLGNMSTAQRWASEFLESMDGISPNWLTTKEGESLFHFSMSFDLRPDSKWTLDDAFGLLTRLVQSTRSWELMVSDKTKAHILTLRTALERIHDHIGTWRKSPSIETLKALAGQRHAILVSELGAKSKQLVLSAAEPTIDSKSIRNEVNQLIDRLERATYDSLWKDLGAAMA